MDQSKFKELEDILKDISLYEMIVETHTHLSFKEMMPTYRLVRKEICNKYNLDKGEFTQLYAYTRGRI